MIDDKPLINRVANSGIINFNLEEHYPKAEFHVFDLRDYLFMELILKEKDFRKALKEYAWDDLSGKIVLIVCSADAIIPVWAFMLVSSYASDYAYDVFQGDKNEYLKQHYQNLISNLEVEEFNGARVVIKGCSDKEVPPSAYAAMTSKLKPYAQSIMYGEPCSTVPIFKRPRVLKKS